MQSDGKIIVGGTFGSFNGVAHKGITRLNSNGSVDNTFVTVGIGFGAVYAIAIQPDGKIIIGGSFYSYNNTSSNNLARINTDGSFDNTFNVGIGANAAINSIAIQPDGKIIIGGSFTAYNGVSKNRVVRLNSNGSIDNTFNIGTGFDSEIKCIAIQDDGKLLFGGSQGSFNGTIGNSITRLKSNGTVDATFNPGITINNPVFTINPIGRKIFIGGIFNGSINGVNTHIITRLIGWGFPIKVYDDANLNCVKNNTENYLNSIGITVNPGNISGYTSNGEFIVDSLPNGNYTAYVQTTSSWGSNCPTFKQFSMSNQAPSSSIEFGLYPILPCENYQVTSNTNPTLTVSYGETVTLPAITTNSTNQSTTFSWSYLNSPFTLSPSYFSGINTNQLTITNVISSMDNNQNTFMGLVNYGNGCYDTVYYNIDICTNISSQPANLTVASGSDAAFQVSINDPSATFQWYSNFGVLSNTGQYSGAHTDSLTISNVSPSNDNQYFYCVISCQCDNLQYSDTAWLNVNQNTPCTGNHIWNNSQYLTIPIGDNISYTVLTDSSELTFQWYSGSTALNESYPFWGVQTNHIYIDNFGYSYPDSYYCVITDVNNCKDTFYLYVNIDVECGDLIYGDHSRETTVLPGSLVSIDVGSYYAYLPTDTTVGFIPAFQWYADDSWPPILLNNGTDYSGVNNDTLTIHNLNSLSINQFTCIITNTINNCKDTIDWAVFVCDTLTQPYDIDTVFGATVQFIVHINDSSATFQWYSDQGFGFHSLTDAGQYTGTQNDTLTVTDICSVNNHQIFYCVVHSQCWWHTDTVVLTIGNTNSLNALQGMKSVNVFPNPVTSDVYIELVEDYIGKNYYITDNLGRTVKSGTFHTSTEQVNLEHFEKGIYFLNIHEVDGSIKIIKN